MAADDNENVIRNSLQQAEELEQKMKAWLKKLSASKKPEAELLQQDNPEEIQPQDSLDPQTQLIEEKQKILEQVLVIQKLLEDLPQNDAERIRDKFHSQCGNLIQQLNAFTAPKEGEGQAIRFQYSLAASRPGYGQ